MSRYDGKRIADRYQVERKIGSGGMADVFLAEDRVLHRKVAVKILHNQYANDPEFVERFKREAQSAAGLSHPNIVAVFDRGTFEDTFYMVMELLQGQNLKELILKEAPMDQEKVAAIGAQICSALAFAHENGVIHRDIKPQNIIINNGHVKVTDFGIARAANDSDMTGTGTILGTAHYLSPEQARGTKVVEQSDLYSLGVILYEMSTGSLPFTGESPISIALKHVNEVPVPPRQLVGSVPRSLDAIVVKALQKEIDDRYPSAIEMKTDLDLFAKGLPPLALSDYETDLVSRRSAGRTRNTRRADGRQNTGRQSTAIPPPVRDRTRERKKKANPWLWIIPLIIFLLAAGISMAYFRSPEPEPPSTVMVPSMVGRDKAQAEKILTQAGFRAVIRGQEFSDKYPADAVLRQEPEGGDSLSADADKTVYLWLSKGAEKLTAPNLAGLTREEAERDLAGLGLKVGEVSEDYSDRYSEGKVARQNPDSGTQVAKGSAVNIVISKGAEKISIPKVVGMTDGRAVAALQARGFSVSRRYESSASAERGTVIEQDPDGGSMSRPGGSVTITISSGIEKVSVPSVIGFTEEAAKSQIKSLGLKVSVTYKTTDDAPEGTVVSQSPSGGSKQTAGSTISIAIAQGTPPGGQPTQGASP